MQHHLQQTVAIYVRCEIPKPYIGFNVETLQQRNSYKANDVIECQIHNNCFSENCDDNEFICPKRQARNILRILKKSIQWPAWYRQQLG